MTRSAASSDPMSSEPKTTTATETSDDNAINQEDHNNADLIFETLRDKLEAGHGECIYRLSNFCKYIL